MRSIEQKAEHLTIESHTPSNKFVKEFEYDAMKGCFYDEKSF